MQKKSKRKWRKLRLWLFEQLGKKIATIMIIKLVKMLAITDLANWDDFMMEIWSYANNFKIIVIFLNIFGCTLIKNRNPTLDQNSY